MDGREEVYRWAGPYGEPSGGCGGCPQQHPIPQRPCRQDHCRAEHRQAGGAFLSGSDPRLPQTVEVFSIEDRNVQYAMMACGYVDAIAAHETGILQYMKDNSVEFRILRNRCWSPGWASPLPKTTAAGWTAS